LDFDETTSPAKSPTSAVMMARTPDDETLDFMIQMYDYQVEMEERAAAVASASQNPMTSLVASGPVETSQDDQITNATTQSIQTSNAANAPVDSTVEPSAEAGSASEAGAEVAAAAPTQKRAKRRNKNNKKISDKNKVKDIKWPLVDPELQPMSSQQVRRQLSDNDYNSTAEELTVHQEFFKRRPSLVRLKQETPKTSLQLFTENDKNFILPKNVMLDSGANVLIMISPAISKAFGLTIISGSAPLKGVGGYGGSLGRTVEKIRIRLGGCELGQTDIGPLQGCFTITTCPIVMTQTLVDTLHHDVILGQGYIRLCLGTMDPLAERFYYSPAFAHRGCREFRVSVPCVMSVESTGNTNVVATALSTNYHESLTDLLEGCTPTICSQPQVVAPAVPTKTAAKGTQAGKGKKDKNSNKNFNQSANAVPAMATRIAPGFPQTTVPTRAEYNQQREQQQQRNAETRTVAHETIAAAHENAANGLVNVIPPLGIVYSFSALKSSGRLLDSGRLDMSGSAHTVISQVQQMKESIKADLVKELTQTFGQQVPAPQAPTPKPAVQQQPLKITTAPKPNNAVQDKGKTQQQTVPPPVQTPATAPSGRASTSNQVDEPDSPPPPTIIRQVAATKQVDWGSNTSSHLPYSLPRVWRSYADALMAPAPTPVLKHKKADTTKAEAVAKAAVTVALTALVPKTNAAPTSS
jgi:hypothetical protein